MKRKGTITALLLAVTMAFTAVPTFAAEALSAEEFDLIPLEEITVADPADPSEEIVTDSTFSDPSVPEELLPEEIPAVDGSVVGNDTVQEFLPGSDAWDPVEEIPAADDSFSMEGEIPGNEELLFADDFTFEADTAGEVEEISQEAAPAMEEEEDPEETVEEEAESADASGEYGAWSAWSATPVSATSNRQVETRTVIDGYNSYTWYRIGSRDYYNYNPGLSGVTRQDWGTVAPDTWAHPVESISPGGRSSGQYAGKNCGNVTGYNLNNGVICFKGNAVTHTEYRYRDRIMQYTLTFHANGHGTAPAAQVIREGNPAVKPENPTASGYTFVGWYQEASGSNAYDFSTPMTSDRTVYAKWKANPKTYTVTFRANGHGTATPAQKVISGNTVKKPANPTSTAYNFKGWYLDPEGTKAYDFSTKVTKSFTLYAKWSIKYFKVTFSANGHGTAPKAQSVRYNGLAKKPASPTASNYTFKGWYTDKACKKAYNFSTKVTKNLVLYAKWQQKICTVTFKANGHGTAPAAQKVAYGKYATYPTSPYASGYSFYGWYTDSACTNLFYFYNTKITRNIVLYAKWQRYVGISRGTIWSCKSYVPLYLTYLQYGDRVVYGSGYESHSYRCYSNYSYKTTTAYFNKNMRNYTSFYVKVYDKNDNLITSSTFYYHF